MPCRRSSARFDVDVRCRRVTADRGGRPRTECSLSTWWRGCGPSGTSPHPRPGRDSSVRPADQAGGSGMVEEAHLAGPAVRRVAELREGLVGAVPVLVELVDLASFLAGGDLAAELPG